MIVRKGCCSGRRVNGFRSFGAAITDFDTFIKGVVGAATDMNQQMLVISEYLCGRGDVGRGEVRAALYDLWSWYTPMVQVLNEMDMPDVRDAFMQAAGVIYSAKAVHRSASCAGSATTGSSIGSSTGMSVEDMITKGESLTKSVIDLFDGDKAEQPVTNTPPGTTGTTPPAAKKATNWMTFVAIGAAGLAAAMLLPKKK